ncbi:MAG: PASTA domain-containing protein [Fibromonadaceae bacterium]|jgi:cell division protein FtsI/penicillin-binding protein 2|nr:PASTA domain-containing protein [Fibromonadaceae bacterium]
MNKKLIIIGVFLSLASVGIIARLVQIQLVNNKIYYKDKTQEHRYEEAKFGRILDRNGVVLWDNLLVSEENHKEKFQEIHFYGYLEGLSAILSGVANSKINELRGQKGVRRATVKPKRDVPISEKELTPLIDGHDVYLSIDLRIQEIAEKAVREFVPKFGAAGASVLVMDPRTGQILAITNFNPDSKKYESTLHSFEPGSIFKPITAIIALENGIDPGKRIKTESGKWQVTKNLNEKIIKDTKERESCDMQEAIVYSSNIAFGKYVIEEIGYGNFFDGIRNFGIGEKSADFPLNVIHKGFSRVHDLRTQAVQGIGQSIDLTSIDIVKALSSIANGGILYNPKLILKNGMDSATTERDSVRRVISSTENTRLLRDMLRGVIESGTGANVKSKFTFFEFAGKTGTAQVIDSLGKYMSENYNSSFVGMERASDPNFICLVTMYNTKRAGSTAAGPVFQKIMEEIYLHPSLSPEAFAREYAPVNSICSETSFIGHTKIAAFDKAKGMRCNVRFDDEKLSGSVVAQTIKTDSTGEYLELSLREHQRNTGLMPDVRGLTLRDAIGMLEHVKVSYEGTGKVYEQFPEPGSLAERKSKVLIRLKENI